MSIFLPIIFSSCDFWSAVSRSLALSFCSVTSLARSCRIAHKPQIHELLAVFGCERFQLRFLIAGQTKFLSHFGIGQVLRDTGHLVPNLHKTLLLWRKSTSLIFFISSSRRC